MPTRSRRSAIPARTPSSSSCRAAWASPSCASTTRPRSTFPLIGPAFSFSQDILAPSATGALGVINTSQWNKDIDNEINNAFVAAFQEEYGRLPSLYASQAFDTANLIISAAAKADIGDLDAFRAALKEADFDSTRGDFRFGNNNHPIQTIYVREVVEEDGVLTNRIIGTALEDHQDAYAADCPMD
jgi:branched-chain amino acid transport system substrate-binding protein